MKKTYTKPISEAISLRQEGLLETSSLKLNRHDDVIIDNQETQILSNKRPGFAKDLWED